MGPERRGDRENLAISAAELSPIYTLFYRVAINLSDECGLSPAGIVSNYTGFFIHFAKVLDEY
jgi:hypothetical protein